MNAKVRSKKPITNEESIYIQVGFFSVDFGKERLTDVNPIRAWG